MIMMMIVIGKPDEKEREEDSYVNILRKRARANVTDGLLFGSRQNGVQQVEDLDTTQ